MVSILANMHTHTHTHTDIYTWKCTVYLSIEEIFVFFNVVG